MSTFYLIRHGATDAVGHVLTGRIRGIHLNERGRRQAGELPRRFTNVPISAIYASPMERTQETAAPLAASLGLPVQLAEEITEVDYGEWTGRAVQDLLQDAGWQRFNSFRSSTPIPGGESALQIQARVIGFLTAVHRASPQEHIAIVSHGDPIKTAVLHYLGLHLDMFFRFAIDPASVTVVRVTSDDACAVAINTHDVRLDEYIS